MAGEPDELTEEEELTLQRLFESASPPRLAEDWDSAFLDAVAASGTTRNGIRRPSLVTTVRSADHITTAQIPSTNQRRQFIGIAAALLLMSGLVVALVTSGPEDGTVAADDPPRAPTSVQGFAADISLAGPAVVSCQHDATFRLEGVRQDATIDWMTDVPIVGATDSPEATMAFDVEAGRYEVSATADGREVTTFVDVIGNGECGPQPIEIVDEPEVAAADRTSFDIQLAVNEVCSNASFTITDPDGRVVGTLTEGTQCQDTRVVTSSLAVAGPLEPSTTYGVDIAVDGQPYDGNGPLRSGAGMASATIDVMTTGAEESPDGAPTTTTSRPGSYIP